jgi:endoglucanase
MRAKTSHEIAVIWALTGGVIAAHAQTTQVISEARAKVETSDWGTFHVYYTGETRGTRDGFTGVANIKPGQEVHPAHTHAEEEYLLITQGSGTWTVGDKVFAAKTGDMLYAAPWDLHGIRNTGSTNLKFAVWKWNAKGMPVPTARTDSLPVGRCINMGNHLESPNEGDWGRKIADDDFAIIAKAGFNTIRLPVRWAGHAAVNAPYTIDAAFMARVEHVVGLARVAGLNVILNSHNFDDLHAKPDENVARLAGIWTQVAAHFAGQSRDHLWFEIENEPHDKLTNANLVATLAPALAAIRKTNPDRPVIIGGEFWSGIDSLATLTLPADPHILPTFHYYEPFDFTHQGATWVNPVPPVGRIYGTEADVDRLVKDVAKVRAYIKRTGKTPFMGEFGANGPIPLDQRVTYQRTIRTAFDTTGIGMCAWGYTNTFPLYDNAKKVWVPGMRAAMGLTE